MASDPNETVRRDSLGRRIGKVSRKGAENRRNAARANAIALNSLRWDAPIDPREIIDASDQNHGDRIVERVLANRTVYLKRAQSIAVRAMPDIMREMGKMALGRVRNATAADRVAASKFVRESAQDVAHELGLAGRVNLTECSLDQLETLLSGALGAVRDAQAIESTAIQVPVTGTAGAAGDPDPTSDQAAGQAANSSAADPAGGG